MFSVDDQPVPIDLDEVFRMVDDILGNAPITLMVNTHEMSPPVISMHELENAELLT